MPTANTLPVRPDSILIQAAHVVPSTIQYNALQDEYIAFIHFGPNTFTRKEWGNGMEDPQVFDLRQVDTDQWCETLKAGGMTKVIFTAKHHDGFVMWQSRYTSHGIMSSPFENGQGDILKALSESCHKYGLKLAVYLSPADLFQIESPTGLYGNLSAYTERTIPRPIENRPFANKTTFTAVVDDYNEYFMNQLFELLTEYGPIHEVWFDGAHPKRKGGQTYNYLAWKKLIRTLAPEAVIFGKEDIRWCGNEDGATRETEWNVVPYAENPHDMNLFPDLMGHHVGEKEQLLKGQYLHYQPAETNTSIREGWFYRDETQKVRSADDVFDMYERAVGGNSIFLLNFPPNREGLLPDEDVQVIKEVGDRIQKTYGTNLIANAKGAKKVLDGNATTFELLDDQHHTIEIRTPAPVTINRMVIQEAIQTHGERVALHVVEALLNGKWEEIARSTNIGYKRILRFPTTTASSFRFKVLESRYHPAVSHISAHYCELNPPRLEAIRDVNGWLTLQPLRHDFSWNAHGLDPVANLIKEMEIRYTLDGSEPTRTSEHYSKPLLLEQTTIKAKAFVGEKSGATTTRHTGFIKNGWKLLSASSQEPRFEASKCFDGNLKSFWLSAPTGQNHHVAIDLGAIKTIHGMEYTPQKHHAKGMIQRGIIEWSTDGKKWQHADSFEFGNLINMPTARTHHLKTPVETRYIRVTSNEIAGNSNQAAIAEIDFF